MLAMVDDQPVIVYVDRVENDWGATDRRIPPKKA